MPYQAHADINTGLVGWWKFNESSGNAIDSSGQGRTGTPTGTTIVSGCKRGGCRRFDGVTDRVSIPTSATFASESTVTIASWIYPIATPAVLKFIYGENTSTSGITRIACAYDSAGKIFFGGRDSSEDPSGTLQTFAQGVTVLPNLQPRIKRAGSS